MITSVQNPRIQRAAKLRNHRDRRKQQRFLIDGARELGHAQSAGVRLDELFVCESLVDPSFREQLVSLVSPATEIHPVSPTVLDKLSFGNRREGFVAVATCEARNLDELHVPSPALMVVLDQVEKPGNIGAVIRSADGAGADAVIVTGYAGDLFNPNLIRASLGTVFRLPVFSVNADHAIDWLNRHQIQPFVAIVGASRMYTGVDFLQSVAIVVGSEAQGVGADWSTGGFASIGLPMMGHADSLNVSVSAAIVLYEARRQRDIGQTRDGTAG